jgi:hypothetical protein
MLGITEILCPLPYARRFEVEDLASIAKKLAAKAPGQSFCNWGAKERMASTLAAI